MVIWLERGADFHTAQLMPLPLTVSRSSKIQIGFTFLVPAHPGSPGKRAVKQCVCVVVRFFRNHYDKRIVDKVSTVAYNVNNNVSEKYDTSLHIISFCPAYGTESFCA